MSDKLPSQLRRRGRHPARHVSHDDKPNTHLDETTVALFVEHRLPHAKTGDVERHIDECASCRAVLAAVGRSGFADGTIPPWEEPTLEIGERLGRYVIVGLHGRGGMGTVYAAFDPDLDRKIAIKLLRRGSASADRLLREAQALARISHPGVVAVHDVGTFETQVFIAMEFIRGGTLRTWLAEAQRDWREIVELLLQVGRGLVVAHAARLVHRDVKPDNILVDETGRACVSDFGLAYAVALPRRSNPVITKIHESLTQTGAVVGTPAYMSPEQIAGRAVTALSDQFSFCVTVFEALHGVRPYDGSTLLEIESAMHAHRLSAPTRDVPVWVRDAIVRGLAIEPARRYRSMDALVTALSGNRARRGARYR